MTSSDLAYLVGRRIKMEPLSPEQLRAGRKRNASQASLSSTTSSSDSRNGGQKKLKKYELDPSTDPTVRNAVAAKANREKKKQEEQKLKSDNAALLQQNAMLEKKLKEVQEENDSLLRKLEDLKEQRTPWTDTRSPEEFLKDAVAEVNPKFVELPCKPESTFDDIDVDPSEAWADELFADIDIPALDLISTPQSPAKLDEKTYCFLSPQQSSVAESLTWSPDPMLSSIPVNNSLPRDLFGEFSEQMQNIEN